MNSMILRVRYLYMFDTPDICTIFFHYKLMNFQIVVKEDVRPSPVNTPENCKCDLYIKNMQDYKTVFDIDFKRLGEYLQVYLKTLHRPRKLRPQ